MQSYTLLLIRTGPVHPVGPTRDRGLAIADAGFRRGGDERAVCTLTPVRPPGSFRSIARNFGSRAILFLSCAKLSKMKRSVEILEKAFVPNWNAFVLEHSSRSGAFLQSWEWGNVLEAEGVRVLREGRDGDHALRAQALSALMRLPIGQSYVYIPRGPIGTTPKAEAWMLERLLGAAKTLNQRPIFFRVDAARPLLSTLYSLRTIPDIQPSTTLITDLTLDTNALLAAMHHKTRYNIRLAQKRGVMVEAGSLDAMASLTGATAKRHGITLHERRHFEAMLEHLHGENDAPRAFVMQAVHEGDVLASALCVDFGTTRTYVHGASSDTKKSLMAPYALHGYLMQDAKRHGMTAYDWWGIAPEGDPHHRLAGVTRFKRGFGGEVVEFPRTQDVVLRPWLYRAYRLMRKHR